MEIRRVKLEELIPYENNPRSNDKAVEAVAESIYQCGYCSPIVVDEDMVILAGHTRLKALQMLEWNEVEVCIKRGLSEDQKRKYRILDNKTNEFADWDLEKLEEELKGLDFGDFDFGFDISAVSDSQNGEVEEVDIPTEVQTVCKKGDIWQLGRHRLMCGDSTSKEDVDALVDGSVIDLLITDPPYNVALGQHNRPSEARELHRRTDGLVIENDSWDNDEDFVDFLVSVYENALSVMKEGAVFYIWYASNQVHNFTSACVKADMKIRQELIWNKNTFTLGRQDYQWKHEPCLYGWKDGAAHLWNSDRKQTTVIDFEKPGRSELHPTMKPIGLFAYQIRNSSAENENVLDLFGGSGTTMIACEQCGRNSFLMELDPHYCDVIIERWEQYTGQKAVLING